MSATITTDIQLQLNSNYYLNLVSFTLLFYDYFLTLGWEVSRFWGLSFTAPNILFFLNRYGQLLGSIPVIFQYFWTEESGPEKLAVCDKLHSFHQYFAVATQIIIGVMLILRTYALYERNQRVAALMIVVAAGVIAVGAWSVLSGSGGDTGDVPDLPIYIGCSSGVPSFQTTRLAIAWGGMGVFDCTIFILTLYRALSRRRARGIDLVTMLLRDGSIYFGVIVVATMSNILTFILASPYTRGLPTTFTNVISSIMVSRLMLNLRDPTLTSMSGRLTITTTGRTLSDHAGVGTFSTAEYIDTREPLDTAMINDYNNRTDFELESRLYR